MPTKSRTSPEPELKGLREARLLWVPPRVSTASAVEAIQTARAAGVHLDLWQQDAVDAGLGELADSTWAAIEVVVIAPRRNGKNEAGAVTRELAGAFVFEEGVIVHTAHRQSTALKAHTRLRKIIESRPKLAKRVRRAPASNSQGYGFILDNDCEIWFETRTEKAGRGSDADVLIVDEALYATDDQMGAVIPLILARPNPQIWYLSSAADRLIHPAVVLARARDRGIRKEPRIALIEHSAAGSIESHDPTDRRLWVQANPSLNGGRPWSIRGATMAAAQRSMPRRKFAVEVLGIGDWPKVEEDAEAMVLGGKATAAQWLAAKTEQDTPAGDMSGPVSVGIESTNDGARTSVGVAFIRSDGARQVEEAYAGDGQLWVLNDPDEGIAAIVRRRDPVAVVIDPGGPAASLIEPIERMGIEVTKPTARQVGQAWGALTAGVREARPAKGGGFASGAVLHAGQESMDDAALGVRMRSIGDLFAGDREGSSVNTAPLWSAVLALHGLGSRFAPAPAPVLVASGSGGRSADAVDLSQVGF